jgi:beta-glucan synthesis-associated protein KRE6
LVGNLFCGVGLTTHNDAKGHWYEGMEYNSDNETKSELNPFFYGVTLVHSPKSYTYQADALSANTQLRAAYYQQQHVYRVEWDPPQEDGTGGYIRWYTDSVFIYGVHADSLNITGTEIPREAMYLIMNTAVASSWGFPAPCPNGCTCECFECENPDCECALPTGYCDNFPASFEIDYVRVYQAFEEPKHTLGCSPDSRPTSLYIKGHQEKYMEKGDKRPLEPVANGGASCLNDKGCGGAGHGQCSPKGFCACKETYTGPTCMAHAGFYDFESSDETPEGVGCKLHVSWIF